MSSNILFIMYPLKGPHYASFGLAKRLKKKGMNVIYVAPLEFESLILIQGFSVHVINLGPALEAIAWERFAVSCYMEILDHAKSANDAIFNILRQAIDLHAPVAAIVDSDIIGFAMVFRFFKVNVILLNQHFQSDLSSEAPPFNCSFVPRERFAEICWIRFLWIRRLLIKSYKQYQSSIHSKGVKDTRHHRLAQICGIPRHCLDHKRVWNYRITTIPEYFLYPQELDFKRTFMRNQFFLGPMLDLDRKDVEFNWGLLPPSSKIIYCSLGTLAGVYQPQIVDFYLKLVKIFATLPGLSLILSVGADFKNTCKHIKSKNILILEHVPQLQVLEQVDLMINHGGINTVKECIYFGVPMLVYPLCKDNDQPGTAARVMYHHLGAIGSLSDGMITIKKSIFKILEDPSYKESVEKMRSIFHTYDEFDASDVPLMNQLLKTTITV